MQGVVRKSIINYIRGTYRNNVRDRIVAGVITFEEANKCASHSRNDNYWHKDENRIGDGIIWCLENAVGVSFGANLRFDSHAKDPWRIDGICDYYIHRAIYDVLEREIYEAYRGGVRDAAKMLENHDLRNAKKELWRNIWEIQNRQSRMATVLKDINEGFYEIKGKEGSIVNGIWSLCPHDDYYDLTYRKENWRVTDEHLVSLFDKVRKAA